MKLFHSISLSILIASPLFSNIGPQGFKQFPNHYFIETGTFSGDGILKALDAGFKEVRSIEFDNHCYLCTKSRCAQYKNVHIFNGDSSKDLYAMIEDITIPVTFWLDAHVCPARTDGGKNCPLIEELEQIKRHPVKTHTILIDDMHCAGTILFDFLTKEDLIEKILEINSDYQISYVDGGDDGEYKNNVMVAMILQ